ncbi:MAG: hypothetical protein ACI9RM_000978 [Ulvibacter sp.]|jgi:hypothetical protein
MSLKDYEELKKVRLEEGAKSNAHYKSVDLPGRRSLEKPADEVRARIAAMKIEKDKIYNKKP